MKLRKLVIAAAVLVAVVVVAVGGLLAYVAATVDPNDYRDDIAGELEQVTGRKVTLGGPLELSLSLTPALVANDVTIENVAWGSRAAWATIKRLQVRVDLMALLDDQIHVHTIDIEGADVLFETDKDGKGNWVLGSPDTASTGAVDFRVDDIAVRDSTVAYLDGATGQRRQIDVSSATLTSDSMIAPTTVDMTLTVDGVPLTVKGSFDNLASLRSGRDTALDLALSAPNVDVTAKGTLAGAATQTPFDLALSADIASLGLLSDLGLVDLPVDGPLKLTGHLTGSAIKPALGDLNLQIAGTTLTGSLAADLSGTRPSLSGELAADKLDLATWSSGGSAASSDKVFPSDPLPLGLLGALDADLKLTIGTLTAGGMAFDDVAATIKLASSRLDIAPLEGKVDNDKISGSFTLDGSKNPAAMALKLDSTALDVGSLLKASGATDALAGKADLVIDIDGSGASIAAIMAALDGKASVVMTDGRLDENRIDPFVGGATAVIGGLFSKDSDSTKLSCLAAAWDIKAGIATQSVLLVDTEYSTVTGEGTIDLSKETIDETITPRAKGVTLSMSVPVRVGGTLANPTFTPDEGALALKVGSLIGSVFFPPAALLGLGEVGLGKDHPCLTANQAGGSGTDVSTQGVLDGAGSVIDDAASAVGDAVDSLFGN